MDHGKAGCGQVSYGRQISHSDQGANRELGWAGEGVWNKRIHCEWTRCQGRESEKENKQEGKVLAGMGESMDKKPGIKALDGSAKASGAGGKHWDSVGKTFRTRKNRILKPTTWGEWDLPKEPRWDRLSMKIQSNWREWGRKACLHCDLFPPEPRVDFKHPECYQFSPNRKYLQRHQYGHRWWMWTYACSSWTVGQSANLGESCKCQYMAARGNYFFFQFALW